MTTTWPRKVGGTYDKKLLYRYKIRGSPEQKGPDFVSQSIDELLLSVGHRFPYRSGGPFMAVHRYVRHLPAHRVWTSSKTVELIDSYYTVNGVTTVPDQVTDVVSYLATLNGQGGTGWNKFAPTSPQASVAVALFEGWHDGLPSIPGVKAAGDNFLKRGSGEYLNYTFGWLPLIRDLRKIYALSKHLDKSLKQLHRDNGQTVRRSGTISHINSTDSSRTSNTAPLGYGERITTTPNYGLGYTDTQTVTDERYWFSGRFRYYIPKMPEWLWDAYAVAQLYGAVPDLKAIWEATPWTWLIDWHVNVGAILGNISMSVLDNLVADYAYAMGTVSSETTSTTTFTLKSSLTQPGTETASCTLIRGSSLKGRIAASPFGFGLTPGSLSPRQAATLTALGINRVW